MEGFSRFAIVLDATDTENVGRFFLYNFYLQSNMIDLKFDEKDAKAITEYLKEWEKKGIGDLPDSHTDAIYLVPLIIALLKKTQEIDKKLEELAKKLK